ncbi:MAG: EutN/CcmL family microcompartment protein [Bacteroidota bacterium]
MKLGRVIGNVWATQKDPSLEGRRMLLVQPIRADGTDVGRVEAALDTCDAGPGDTVLFVTSAEAALPFRATHDLTASDATIVGVVDSVTVQED